MNGRVADSVSREIAGRDNMFVQAEEHLYWSAGELALDLCSRALGEHTPSVIVDFPSGFGRAARWFQAAWPDAEFYAVETDQEALEFCSDALGMTPIVSTPYLDGIDLPDNCDLIWSGSLLTHLGVSSWINFFRTCISALAPDGVLVATFHGRCAHMLAADGTDMYGPHVDLAAMSDEYLQTGFAYRNYDDGSPVYGLSFTSPAWVCALVQSFADVKIEGIFEMAWGHQDVIVLRKLPSPLRHVTELRLE